MGGFTADQWKNWSNVFSLYALNGLIKKVYIDNWRKFVLACRIVCPNHLTRSDVELFDTLIMEFCVEFEILFGSDCVTPNMHLHGHLAGYIFDYGPVHSFWLFSFERHNDHLGALPTNKQSVETQFMERFLKESFVMNFVDLPFQYRNEFETCFSNIMNDSSCSVSTQDIELLTTLSHPNISVENKSWNAIHMYVVY